MWGLVHRSPVTTLDPLDGPNRQLPIASVQGNTPWVAPACADCPGSLVLGSAPAWLPPWSRSLGLFPWASILLYRPLDIPWICCPQLPHHPCKNGTHSTCFYSTGGHTPIVFSERSQLSQAIPHFHVERILHQRTLIARFESQRNERRVDED